MIGEGARDTRFLEELCALRNITGFVIAHVDGNDKFGKYISAISAQPGFFDTCKSILIITDNDEEEKSFKKIKHQLNEIDFPSPPRPLEVAKKQGKPSVAIVMMPYPEIDGSPEGCLETLLIPAMESANPQEATCVDTLMNCVNAAAWPNRNSRDKLKVRCLISAVWKDDPMHGLPFCFSQWKNLIPLNHTIFDPLVELLSNYPAWADSDTSKWTGWRQANP